MTEDKLRLCFLASGVSSHTQRWVNYFVDKGHEVHLISADEAYNYKSLKAHLLRPYTKNKEAGFNKSRALNLIIWALQMKGIVRRINPDILHCHNVSSYGSLGTFSRFHPIVLSAWGSDVLHHPERSWVLRQIVKLSLRRADLVTCDAEHMKEPMIRLGADPGKIELIYFAIDTRMFSPEKRDGKIKEKLGIADSPTVISARPLNPVHDVGSLVSAVPAVLEQVPEAKFVIAGTGPQEAELKRLAESLGVLNSVKFAGRLPYSEVPGYLASSDIFVSTSVSDAGIAASAMEAMACGLPVIVTDFGDNREWVEDGVNGFVVPLRDPQSLAEKIVYLLRNRDVGIEFGTRNREIIEQRNDYYKEMGKVEDIYRDLIKRYK